MTRPPNTRGSSNTNDRGSAAQRRARRAWLLSTFDPDLGPELARCALRCSPDCLEVVSNATMQVDRILAGVDGGRYTRNNIRPGCGPCNNQRSVDEREARHAQTCDGTCSRCRRNRETALTYRGWRETVEQQLEADAVGYATETQDYLEEHGPLPTLRDYLEQTRGAEPA